MFSRATITLGIGPHSSSVKISCSTRHETGHFRDVLPSQSLGVVLKKPNLTQQKHTIQEQTRQHALIFPPA